MLHGPGILSYFLDTFLGRTHQSLGIICALKELKVLLLALPVVFTHTLSHKLNSELFQNADCVSVDESSWAGMRFVQVCGDAILPPVQYGYSGVHEFKDAVYRIPCE